MQPWGRKVGKSCCPGKKRCSPGKKHSFLRQLAALRQKFVLDRTLLGINSCQPFSRPDANYVLTQFRTSLSLASRLSQAFSKGLLRIRRKYGRPNKTSLLFYCTILNPVYQQWSFDATTYTAIFIYSRYRLYIRI